MERAARRRRRGITGRCSRTVRSSGSITARSLPGKRKRNSLRFSLRSGSAATILRWWRTASARSSPSPLWTKRKSSDEEIEQVVRKAINYGINFFDLCAGAKNVYDPFGRAIQGQREKILVQRIAKNPSVKGYNNLDELFAA